MLNSGMTYSGPNAALSNYGQIRQRPDAITDVCGTAHRCARSRLLLCNLVYIYSVCGIYGL